MRELSSKYCGASEDWSNGVLECWKIDRLQDSSTPTLQHSNRRYMPDIPENTVCYKTGVITCQDEQQLYAWREKFVDILVRKDPILQDEVNDLCDGLKSFLIDRTRFYQNHEEVFGQRFFIEFFPFFMLSDSVKQAYFKYHGYVGDYETIATIYENNACGMNRIGKLLDRWALNISAARAVRNRRHIMYEHLTTEIKHKGTIKTASIGCGPATEVIELSHFITNNQLHIDLIDNDLDALNFARSTLTEHGLVMNVRYIQKNILALARNGKSGSSTYDVIYSLGVIDYFKDTTVVRLLNWIYHHLSHDGLAILGNFKEGHRDESFMKYILDWNLINRHEKQLESLARKSKFKESEISVISGEEGIQLFLVIRKQGIG